MIYALGTLVGAMLVLGQLLWRSAVRTADLTSMSAVFGEAGLRLLLSPRLLGGTAIYVLATVLYLYLQGRFEYHMIQMVVVSSSLFLSFVAASALLGERLLLEDYFGLALLIAGVLLIGRR